MSEPLQTLDSLSSSLDEIEALLEPLFERSLVQIGEDLDPLQKAKLQVLLSYVTQDLVLIYLKTKGLDPSKHPVNEELRRVKSYFDKIKETENPAARGLVVDRAAASRFIRAAITDAQASGSSVATPAPVGTHTRFSGVVRSIDPLISESRSEPRRDNENDSSSSDGDLQVIDGASISSHKSESTPPRNVAGTPIHPTTSAKRRRMTDPFAGYTTEAEVSQAPVANSTQRITDSSRKRRKHRTPNEALG